MQVAVQVRSAAETGRGLPSAFTSRSTKTSDGSLAVLATIGTVARFARNETIFNEGDDARYNFKVLSGAVRLCRVMPDGRRQIAEFALPGDFFGFEWQIEHALTAEALSDNVTVVQYARSRLDRLGEESSEVRQGLNQMLRHELWAAQNHLVMLGRQSARERVAAFIQLLSKRADDSVDLDVAMTRQDIADYLGLTIETVCREFSNLKRGKVIDIPSRHRIVVRDMEHLESIACGEE